MLLKNMRMAEIDKLVLNQQPSIQFSYNKNFMEFGTTNIT